MKPDDGKAYVWLETRQKDPAGFNSTEEMTGEKILIIGATGYIGRHVAKASVALGHSTFVLVRSSTVSDPSKAELIESFKASSMTIIQGSIEDKSSLVAAIKQVDIVISTVGVTQQLDQINILEAIKEVGTIKRFLPSEFGNDVDKVDAVQPVKNFFDLKKQIRRAVEASGVPYTYISSNCFAGYFASNLVQPGQASPPRDKVAIYGDGNVKAVFAVEEDIGIYTIKAAKDARTLNKTVYIRPPANVLTQNELIATWEKKIGKTLEKVTVSEEDLLKQTQETPLPLNMFAGIIHNIFILGNQYKPDLLQGLEASELYPDVKYTTIDEYLNRFL